jgi:hypothetical protein
MRPVPFGAAVLLLGAFLVRAFLQPAGICARGVFWLSGSAVVSQDGSCACISG